jgi:hypothetical protein
MKAKNLAKRSSYLPLTGVSQKNTRAQKFRRNYHRFLFFVNLFARFFDNHLILRLKKNKTHIFY